MDKIRTVETLELGGYAVETRTHDELSTEVLDFAKRLENDDRVDLTIEEARALTLANNLDMRVALIDPEIAATRISEAEAQFESLFYFNTGYVDTDQPTASTLSGSQVKNFDFTTGVQIPLLSGGDVTVDFIGNRTETDNAFSVLNPAVDTDLRASISQPLLRGAGRWTNTYQLRVASLEYGISSAQTKLEIISQLARVERAYWLLYAARESLRVRQQEYELAVAQLERAQRRVRAGADAEIEVIRSEEGVAERLEGIIRAQNAVLNQERELKRVMNSPDLPLTDRTLVIPVTPPDPVEYNLEPGPLLSAALANRMELLDVELRLLIDSSTIDLRRNETLMRLDVDASYNLNGLDATFSESVSNLAEGDFADWRVAVQGEIPIGNEAARSRLRSAVLTRLQRLSTRDSRRQVIEQEVLDAMVRLEADWRRVLAARQSSVLASRTLAAEQRQFDVGRRTSTDVLQATTRLADAQTAEIIALTDYQITQVDLAVATGTMLGATRIDWEPIDPTLEPNVTEGNAQAIRVEHPDLKNESD
jgi:outer membrane protein TolC